MSWRGRLFGAFTQGWRLGLALLRLMGRDDGSGDEAWVESAR